ncbi:hypothetical protein Tco_1175743 [Tanacetum coccineum]
MKTSIANTQGCVTRSFGSCGAKENFWNEGAVGLLFMAKMHENNLVQTRGWAAAMALSWEDLKKLLMEEYCQDDAV